MLQELRDKMGADLVGATIVRVRGLVSVHTAVTTNVGGALLGGIIQTDVSTAVDPANEGPNAKPFADWFLWEPFYEFAHQGGVGTERMLDVKSSRRVEELDEEAFLYIAAPPSNTGDVNVVANLSIGLKLP